MTQVSSLSPGGTASKFTAAVVGGSEYYPDENSGELIPLSQIQARIENYKSGISFSCDYNANTCTGAFRAGHTGMWHATSQTLSWYIKNIDTGNDMGVPSLRTNGQGCRTWATYGPSMKLFCIEKSQDNTHSVSISSRPCTAKATLTTEHAANYSWLGGIDVSVGYFGMTPFSFGANYKTSFATPVDWHDTTCDEWRNPPPSCGDPAATNYGAHEECVYGGEPPRTDWGYYGTPSPGSQYQPPYYQTCTVWWNATWTVDANGNRTSGITYGPSTTVCSWGYT